MGMMRRFTDKFFFFADDYLAAHTNKPFLNLMSIILLETKARAIPCGLEPS